MPTIGNQALPFDPSRSSGKPRDAQRFNGDGATLSFTLSSAVDSAVDIEVYVDNIPQEPLTAYDVNGNSITFTEAPPVGAYNVRVIYRNFQTGIYTSVPDGSISYQKLANNIRLFTTDNHTGDNTTVAFALTTAPADANTVFVSIDGIVQRAPIHYTTSGTTITFTSAPPTSSNVHIRHLGFRTTSTVTALSANTTITQPVLASPSFTGNVQTGASFTGNLSATGTLAITGATTLSSTLAAGNTTITGTLSATSDGTVGGRFGVGAAASATYPLNLVQNDNNFIRLSAGNSRVWRIGATGVTAVAGTFNLIDDSAGLTRLSVDYLGAVTMPAQPCFLATGGAAANVTGDDIIFSPIVYGTEIKDQGGNYDNATGIFTAPVTGSYVLSALLGLEGLLSTHAYAVMYIETSNRTYQLLIYSALTTNPNAGVGGTMTVVADMDTGDTARVKIQVGSSTKVVDVVGGAYGQFSGHLAC